VTLRFSKINFCSRAAYTSTIMDNVPILCKIFRHAAYGPKQQRSLLVDKVKIKSSQRDGTEVSSFLGFYTVLISKYFPTFRSIVFLSSSGPGRPRGVKKLLRDST
jgi:hypothetical protein